MFRSIRLLARTAVATVAVALGAGAQEPAPVHVALTKVGGVPISGKVVLYQDGKLVRPILLPTGTAETSIAPGRYDAHIIANTRRVALLVEMMPLVVSPGSGGRLAYELIEGATEAVPLTAFDQDGDRVLDRVEMAQGTDPADPASYPGAVAVSFPSPVLSGGAGWYRGELQAHSNLGRGSDSVKDLIRRAERAKLDFLAITDRGTMASVQDPAYSSNSVVLIPGMEWGSESLGLGLIYGPRTLPESADTMQDAQAVLERVQRQGGAFIIAHPCFPNAPWQWGLSFANGIEVWCRDWGSVPGSSYTTLMEPLRARENGRLIHSIALAMANPLRTSTGSQSEIPTLSANGQAQRFYDYELARGLKATLIGGSNSASKSVPLGEPITYVYAREKSAAGILEGIRLGRTMVAKDIHAPRITFKADAGADGRIDVGEGGVVPLGMPIDFIFHVEGGKGLKVQLIENGIAIRTIELATDREGFAMQRKPVGYSTYRVRVVGPATEDDYGPTEMYAMTSPIYAQTIMPYDPNLGPDAFWFRLDPDRTNNQEPDFTKVESVSVDNLQRF